MTAPARCISVGGRSFVLCCCFVLALVPVARPLDRSLTSARTWTAHIAHCVPMPRIPREADVPRFGRQQVFTQYAQSQLPSFPASQSFALLRGRESLCTASPKNFKLRTFEALAAQT
ncbi:hypothetical protein BKA62DRAFT_336685 [Auriculariales sp. MPI-PUGE-AT-0066]|nr:hypothetical protein BKA62DRAFT_336685 [Auriculariales sp. MPI-PUGE-AT-0066]